jgi:hypothetical protein
VVAPLDERDVVQAGGDDLAADRVGQRDVGADVQAQPAVAPLGDAGPSRVDGVHPGTVAQALQHVVEEDGVGFPGIRAPQHDQVGVFGLDVGGGATTGTEDCR